MVRCETERSLNKNKQIALSLLKEKLIHELELKTHNERSLLRKNQLGSGMRGDKRRTIKFKENIVVDDITKKKWNLDKYFRGDWD
jgi:peptide chain release factor 1